MKKTSLILVSLVLVLILGVCAFIFLVSSKKDKEVATPDLPVNLPNKCEAKNFPANSRKISKIKSNRNKLNVSSSDWYGKFLKAFKEKPLFETSNKELEIYRFTWLRTFHHPVVIKIEKQKDKVSISFKELDGLGGYKPGKIINNEKNSMGKENWCKFIKLLNETDYWQMKTQDDVLGEDGASWILEGVKENRYHVVDRWSPSGGKYREACVYLLKLSGFLDRTDYVLY